MIFLFGIFGFGLLIRRFREIPKVSVEHSIYSREFALFLGAFTICFAAAFITIGTSSPIITNIIKGHAAAVDTSYYVKTIVPLGIVIALLTGIGQLLWWKTSSARELLKGALYPLISSVIFTIGLVFVGVRDIPVVIFSFASAFALFVNIYVGFKIFVGNPRYAGGAIAHIGLALLFLGFVSSARYDDKQTVSLEQGKSKEILGGYTLTYMGNRQIDNERYGFTVEIRHANETYVVMPVIRYSTQSNSMMRHPDILNMYTKDLYISPLSVESPADHAEESFTFSKGEVKEVNGLSVKFIDFDFNDEEKGKMVTGGDATIGVNLEVKNDGRTEQVKPLFRRTENGSSYIPATLSNTDIQFTIVKMQPNREDPAQSKVEIAISNPTDVSHNKPKAETLVVEASIKPFINLVWMGTITLVVGFIVTIIRRVQEAREKE